ncbi:MAG: ABC-F family ATP-binding cassette domain-containing protein [Chloroherpetonaceae bacterium]|nr:ABC-F family ATP-binding cassette domain-containing protein [Chloroherpetonaceae bacterium]MDW8436568.1 ABC-F family ATP-binding cassette domain-containing protein [Chloroherpetonaceae bacterium]
MLEARNLSLSVGTKELLIDASFRVGDKDRVGLVGSNGAGKSTLLKFIAGQTTAQTLRHNGQILKSSDATIGYLPQEISFEGDLEKTALEYALQANERAFKLSQDLERMEKELALPLDHESEAYQRLIEKFSDATREFERLGGYRMKADAEKVLSGLGFSQEDFRKKVKEFSGGWQMRLLIAKLLLQNNSLLLLDEPTNHLDIDSLRWLENYLLAYSGAFIVVSHDRYFLDKLTTKTLEISFKRVTEYKGNYSFYERQKAERYETLMAEYENKLKQIAHLQRFVDRFKAKATKASQAQSRVKMIQKLQQTLEAPEEDSSHIEFSFPKAAPSGKIVLTLEGVTKTYALPDHSTKVVLNNIDLEIMRGERIAIVGSNGAGKSTLCKIISGEIDFEGKRVLGHNVRLAFFGQHQAETLNQDNTVLEEMLAAAPDSEARTKARDVLGCFLFSGDDAHKKVRMLSGGEKSRLALAKMLLTTSNFLVLDEPTNHLDMRSKEMLIEALDNYDGTLVIVSHDRHFLDSLVEKVVLVQNGKLRVFSNGYADFVSKMEAEAQAELERRKEAQKSQAKAQKPVQSAPPKAASNKKRLEKIERQIETLEAEKVAIENEMSSPEFFKRADSRAKTTRYATLQAELEKLYAEWEAIAQ